MLFTPLFLCTSALFTGVVEATGRLYIRPSLRELLDAGKRAMTGRTSTFEQSGGPLSLNETAPVPIEQNLPTIIITPLLEDKLDSRQIKLASVKNEAQLLECDESLEISKAVEVKPEPETFPYNISILNSPHVIPARESLSNFINRVQLRNTISQLIQITEATLQDFAVAPLTDSQTSSPGIIESDDALTPSKSQFIFKEPLPESKHGDIFERKDGSYQAKRARSESSVHGQNPFKKARYESPSRDVIPVSRKTFSRVERIWDDKVESVLLPKDFSRICVFNLNKNTQHSTLEDLFTPFGRINDIWIVRDNVNEHENFAFIEFAKRSAVLLAMKSMTGKYVDDRHIGVVIAPDGFVRNIRKLRIRILPNAPLRHNDIEFIFNVECFKWTIKPLASWFEETNGGIHGYILFNSSAHARKAFVKYKSQGLIVNYEIC